jgi:hypothetical protein
VLLLRVKLAHRAVQAGADRLVTRVVLVARRGPQADGGIQSFEDVPRCENTRAQRCQLDRVRQSIQLATNGVDIACVVRRDRKARHDRSRAIHEQADRARSSSG